MNRTEFKGYVGEYLAMFLLIAKGYSILEHRYKTVCGEIDIIARKKNTIAFVEVKSRKNEEKCLIALTPKQLQRVQNAAQIFFKRNPKYQNYFSSFDVILVADWKIPVHIKNISI